MDFWEGPTGWFFLGPCSHHWIWYGKKENWRPKLIWARAWCHETAILIFQMTLQLSWLNSVTLEDWKQVRSLVEGLCLLDPTHPVQSEQCTSIGTDRHTHTELQQPLRLSKRDTFALFLCLLSLWLQIPCALSNENVPWNGPLEKHPTFSRWGLLNSWGSPLSAALRGNNFSLCSDM